MADILNNFLSSVFPVALMFFVGFWLARRGVFDGGEAAAILKFIARIAAPCGLFAAGVLLAAPLDRAHMRLAGYIAGMKMLVHPLLAAGLILWGGGYALEAARTSLLVAVSPVGIMALTFANRYGGEADAIALSILWSFVLSVLAIPVLLAL